VAGRGDDVSDRSDHWQQVYQTKADDAVSWFEASPDTSLDLLDAAGLTQNDAVIDIGGGASRLVDALVARGQAHVSVLDLSAAALDVARTRLGDAASVDWIVSDVLAWQPSRRYRFWHDRAAFHFLTDPADQADYVDVLGRALEPGGTATIGTFAPDGPEKCSGLPVARHDAESLSRILGDGFALIDQRRHAHATPWGSVQNFQFSTFRQRT
jgi:SAM-dependent methyltransferase